jgi:hypothetical protein
MHRVPRAGHVLHFREGKRRSCPCVFSVVWRTEGEDILFGDD